MIRIILALLLSFTFFTSNTQALAIVKAVHPRASTVYICDNRKTEVYHVNKNCSALKRCTREIKEVSESDAINKWKLRKCKTCGMSKPQFFSSYIHSAIGTLAIKLL